MSILSHSLAFPEACDMALGFPFWPATLQPLALVVSPRLGLRQSQCDFFDACKRLHYRWIIIVVMCKKTCFLKIFVHSIIILSFKV